MTSYIAQTIKIGSVMLIATTLAACSLTRTERTALTGGGIGAATGAGIAAVAGGPVAASALLGTAAGAVSGTLFEQNKKRKRRFR